MYTRELLEPGAAFIEKGRPVYGTWTGAFKEADLLAIRRPYPWPLPRWIRDFRIKEWESFDIQNERFYLGAILANLKMFRFAQVNLYDKESGEKLRYIKVVPFSGWKLPKDLSNASVSSRSYGFFFRIHDWLDADTIRVDLDVEATGKRPSFTAHIMYDLGRNRVTPMAVNLGFSGDRCVYAYKALAAVRGDLVFGGRHISLDAKKTTGIFCDFKGFYPYPMQSVWAKGAGFDGEGRRFGFSLGENQTRENHRNNENALWVNGKLTPLPPVRITMPEGVKSNWIIQDVEGMVDLVFSPQELLHNGFNPVFFRAEQETLPGCYNGMLVNAKGERIQVHNLWGTGEKIYLRV
ncbi:MAG: DUF2804 domain-containing protein [Treponema sp.]|jgi:hypothetical protein|nr:DUF2804 domain-containing protein [Treponema sp.]